MSTGTQITKTSSLHLAYLSSEICRLATIWKIAAVECCMLYRGIEKFSVEVV